MRDVKIIGDSSGRPVDADLSFWRSVVTKLTAPSRYAELRANWVVFIFTLLVIYFTWCVWDRFQGALPSKVRSATVTNSPVTIGDEADVRIDLVRNRVCERDFEYIVMDSGGKRERFSEPHMHAIGNPGPDVFTQPIRIPHDLQPGPARLRLIWSWQCPENLYETIYPVTYVYPDIHFQLSDDVKSNP